MRHIVVVLSLLLLVQPAAAQDTFTLTCRIQLGNKPMDKNFYVDPVHLTVNDSHAVISEGQMAWAEYSGDGAVQYDHVVNRYTGSISIRAKDKSGAVDTYTGECALATKKKF